ncbi:hypothetical protein QEN19_004280 [Hanseniaspora menglaensis]
MLSVGDELKDGFDVSINYLEENIVFIDNIKQYYVKRKQLDDTHMQNLKKLNTDQLEIITKQSIDVSVGSKPIMTPGSLTSSTITTFKNIINSDNKNDADIRKVDEVIINELSVLINDLRQLSQYLSNMYKEMLNNYQSISETALNNYKKKYDESTKSMEQARAKGSNEKASKKEIAMNECKNNYLIEISLANRIKDKLYFQDIPELLDLLQNVVKYKIQHFNSILNKYLNNNIVVKKNKISAFNENIKFVEANLPDLDIEMFIKHNKKPWQEPQDKVFIPSPIWYEEAVFNVKLEEDLKILSKKYKQAIKEKTGLQDQVNKNLEILKNLRGELTSTDSDEQGLSLKTLKQYCSHLQKFTSLENENLRIQVVIDSLQNNFKDIDLANLNFKEEKKSGGIFSKIKLGRNKSKSSKTEIASNDQHSITDGDNYSNYSDGATSTSQSLNSTRMSTLTHSEISRGNKPNFDANDEAAQNAVAIYPYSKQADDEISINTNDALTVITPDANGWTEVLNNSSSSRGNVPTSYIKIQASSSDSSKKAPPTVKPRRRKNTTTKKIIVCKYNYQAQGDDEITINVGDNIELLKEADENGWALGSINGQQGLFPISYC